MMQQSFWIVFLFELFLLFFFISYTYENVYPFSVFLNSFFRISAFWFSPETGLTVVDVVVVGVVYVEIGALVVAAKWWSLWLWRSYGGNNFNEILFTDCIGCTIFGLPSTTNALMQTKNTKKTFFQDCAKKKSKNHRITSFLDCITFT